MKNKLIFLNIIIALLGSALLYGESQKFSETRYLTSSIWIQNNEFKTVCYGSGSRFFPISTPFTITVKSPNRVYLFFDQTSKKIKVKNEMKYTNTDALSFMNKISSTEKVELNKNDKYYSYIIGGGVTEGMTKQEVIMALGIPPTHYTGNTNFNQWWYWKSTFNRLKLTFEGDILKKILD